ncbi:uncharacterized protein EI97DRAFT_437283 [Westerdykella ornata]|uniref:BZIP domain-containing protein n=1 Tax=Westerdykella ornata TaxID=318751 RepID=A0A6A6J8Y7_WESOR|nr:uncharacterized protein EI97DRAFT_437283 [Westerdykella ornata]KAF2272106.1 hypothetical protein EI97DRAFT_437283 [Westerdykella ornata]
MADLHSNNSFDSNMGVGLGPAFRSDLSTDMTASPYTTFSSRSFSSETMQTVSPQEIFGDSLGSAPPSTAMTNITTPDMNESPLFYTDSYTTSPMFQSESVPTQNDWYSLFPEQELIQPARPSPPAATPELERTESSESMARTSSSDSHVILDNPLHRRKSSVNGSPVPGSVNKSRRRREGPLPPIKVDPNDPVALKRARNTLAARESRQRKHDHVQNLERQISELTSERDKWKTIALSLGYTDTE